uniref:NADH dehydrogenase subunit 6 n=1 Tax=Synodus macrops TaxID=1585515 RepID=UPI0028D3DA30|nr:NADH dehydrogenase subunit 6 [Synodus macrops]WMY89458.1 NADH dehydrogenase subunit 6 [Synodus macrops]WNV64244.1 NADH dehydrogenase subunit 6 [Synodus macrops]
MAYLMVMFLFGLVVGLVAVASNPAPYFAAFGLVVAAGLGCGVLLGCGGSFLSLVLFLIYLGGMLVVFAYSAALAAEPYPMSWGDSSVLGYVLFYLVGVLLGYYFMVGGGSGLSWFLVDEFKDFVVIRGDVAGVALMYSFGGGMLISSAWVLLLALFVVLELTRGLNRGSLRAV